MTDVNPEGRDGEAHDVSPDRRSSPLERGLDVLELLAERGPCSAKEIGAALDVSRSATYRILDSLRLRGYLEDATPQGVWQLGPAIAKISIASIGSSDVIRIAPVYLGVLSEQARASVGLALPHGSDMIFVHRERTEHSVIASAVVGSRRPLHCTAVGKAYLGALPPADRAKVVSSLVLTRRTQHTITQPAQLLRDIERSIERGWTLERGELDDATACVGAPVLDHRGAVVATISASLPAAVSTPRLQAVGVLVAGTAEAMSRRLGCDPERIARESATTDRMNFVRPAATDDTGR